ncbi:glycosyltransferase family 2 protein [Salinimicrobium sp. HB62]|uniref:glycosyltransferase family 2 protein n=1 Tax=Salinimicrobium sp. HB62 TaxID=3077781 RepID=UPI002D794A3F|nr:glycosyltransferase family 2 protein [Salinimicrobium sp. HB62]
MKTAVVILNWNGKALLEQFLPSVVEHSPEATIYVADNASTDDSVSFLQKAFPQVRIIQNQVNGGFAKGYNEALAGLKEDIFVLLNSDVEVTPGWLPPLLDEMKNGKVAAVQPKILNYRKKDHFEYAGAAGGFIDALGYPYCRGRIFDTLEKDLGQYDENHEVFWASGACMMVRRIDFMKAGGFDEDFFAHQEEIDLCWRFFNMNRKVKAVGGSRVYHLGGGTLNSMHPRKTFLNFRNSLFVLLKNAPKKQLFLLIFFRLILDGLAGIKFIFELKPSHTAAILKAHGNFYLQFRKMLKKRNNLQKSTKYYHKTSVVWAYYLRGNRTFEKL